MVVVIQDVSLFEGKVFVVTGGAGYFGRQLCAELSRRAAQEVRCFDWKVTKRARQELAEMANIVLIEGDIRQVADADRAVAGADCVFHCASFGMSGNEMLQDELVNSVNVDGTAVLLQACIRAGVASFVYTSTCNVVFGGLQIINGDEELDYFPLDWHVDAYSRSKALAEQMVLRSNGRQLEGSSGSLRTCSLRPASLYGPQEERHFPRIMATVKFGLFCALIGDKDARGEWVHVDNLVHAHCLAYVALINLQEEGEGGGGTREESGGEKRAVAEGQAYFISDESPINNFELLRPIIEAYGHSMPVTRVSVPLALAFARMVEFFHRILLRLVGPRWLPEPVILPAEVLKVGVTHFFSTARAKSDLDYFPVISAEQGRQQMVRFWRSKGSTEVKRPSLVEMVLIPVGMLLLFLSAHTNPPFMGPFEVVRILGIKFFMSKKVLKTVWLMAVGIHAIEALLALVLALRIAPENAYEWAIQTFIYGFFSLRLLLRKLADEVLLNVKVD